MSRLDSQLNSIVESAILRKAAPFSQEGQIKEAKSKLDQLNSDEAKGLAKLATVISNISIEPTYQDLYDFVGGLHGRR